MDFDEHDYGYLNSDEDDDEIETSINEGVEQTVSPIIPRNANTLDYDALMQEEEEAEIAMQRIRGGRLSSAIENNKFVQKSYKLYELPLATKKKIVFATSAILALAILGLSIWIMYGM